MHKYIDFIHEIEFKKWETTNEGVNFLMDKIQKFLDKEILYEPTKVNEIVNKLLNRFKDNSVILITILTIVITQSLIKANTLSKILDNVPISTEKKHEIIEKAKENAKKKAHHSVKIHKKKNELWKFMNKLAEKESSSNPNIVNSLGYIGKYQLGKMALKDLELDNINTHKFKKNPNIFPEKAQDRAMIKLLKLNKQYLGEYFNGFDGKIVAGVKITKSGLLAGSHLVGASAVKQFLDSNGKIIPKDGNNVPVTEYIEKFGGYQLTF